MAGARKTKTRKAKGKAKGKSKANTLVVESSANIGEFEELLQSGKITIVLVFADWCGACHKFRENIWNPMLQRNAIHNRTAIASEMINKTRLANAKFDYLPSILVVDEKGNMQNFATPEGKMTNAMPTPQSLDDMTRIVNVPVRATEAAPQSLNMKRIGQATEAAPQSAKNITRLGKVTEAAPQSVNTKRHENLPAQVTEAPPQKNTSPSPLTPWLQKADADTKTENYEDINIIRTRPVATPEGTTYVPQKGGGSFLRMLESVIRKGIKIGRRTRKTKKSA